MSLKLILRMKNTDFHNHRSTNEVTMRTARILALSYVLGALSVAAVNAQAPANLNEAKALSAQTGKPLLMEFVRKG